MVKKCQIESVRSLYPSWCRLGTLVVLLSILLCSCSQWGQHIALWYVTRQLHTYLDLETQQKAFVKDRLLHHLDLVQTNDQQQIFRFFDALKQDVQKGLTDDSVQARYKEYKTIVSRMVLRLLPDVSAFLATLSDTQLDHLVQKIAEDRKRANLSAQEAAEQRATAMVKRVTAWTGKLSAAQHQAMLSAYHEIPPLPDWWEAYQQEQVAHFIGFLRTDPEAPRIEHELIQLWRSPETPQSQEVRELMVERSAAWRQFLIKTTAILTPQQHLQVVAKLDLYQRRLRRFFGIG